MNRAADSICNNTETELPFAMDLWKKDKYGQFIRDKSGQLI